MRKVTLAFVFLSLCVISNAQEDTLRLLHNNRKFVLSAELIHNHSTAKEEFSNDRTLRSGTRLRMMPNQKMPLGKHGNFSMFAFTNILYKKVDVEHFQNFGPSVKWTEESAHIESGLGSGFEFFWFNEKIKVGTGAEVNFDLIRILDENILGITVGPILFFEFKEQLKIEIGDEIELYRPTLKSPIFKIAYIF